MIQKVNSSFESRTQKGTSELCTTRVCNIGFDQIESGFDVGWDAEASRGTIEEDGQKRNDQLERYGPGEKTIEIFNPIVS